MALDELTGELVLPTRDAQRDTYLRNYLVRNPNADVGPNTLVYADACAHADSMAVLFNDAKVIGDSTNVLTARGARLLTIGQAEIGDKLPAVGALGFCTVEASTGGTTIFAGDEIRYLPTGIRYKCLVTKLYADGEECPIQGIDTGPGTNLAAGKQLTWTSPRPGCATTALVAEQSDESGLSGGKDVESDEEYIVRIVARRKSPEASGNESEVIAAIEKTPAVSVQKGFVIPACRGPGTKAAMFTLRPSKAGGSRRPNAAQVALVEANLKALFPGDDGIFGCSLLAQSVTVALEIQWKRNAAGFVDAVPWPMYENPLVRVDNAITISATGFRATTTTDTTTPQVGQTIGLFDSVTGTFKKKRILTVTVIVANRSWTLTFDTTNGASDTVFVPVDDAVISPWSDSLDLLVPPVLAEFDGSGPGEQFATFHDPGIRQRRQPESPAEWPSEIRNRILDPIWDVLGVGDADLLLPAVPYTTTVGTPGVSSYQLELADLAVFAP